MITDIYECFEIFLNKNVLYILGDILGFLFTPHSLLFNEASQNKAWQRIYFVYQLVTTRQILNSEEVIIGIMATQHAQKEKLREAQSIHTILLGWNIEIAS